MATAIASINFSLWFGTWAAHRHTRHPAIQSRLTDRRIDACNAIIAAGRVTPIELATALNKRGGALYYKGEPERAIADYSRAIEFVPNYADAFNNRCWANAVLGRNAEAVADCSRVLRINGTANTFENRGFAHLKAGEFDPRHCRLRGRPAARPA